MTAISPIADVQSRVAAIRRNLGIGNEPTVDATAQLIGSATSFDAFGAAYQEALDRAPARGMASMVTGVDLTTAQRVRTVDTARAASTTSRSQLSGEQVARYAYNAGFRGDDLVKVVAIAKRESNWNPAAFNGNASTGDRSYGLMQINMLGDLGPARLAQLGLSSNDELLDPQTNMNAAYDLYRRSGNTLRAWGGYKGMSDTFGTDLGAAQQVVDAAGLSG